MNGSGSNPDMV